MNHAELKAKALANSEAKAVYDSLAIEFSLLRQMLKVRQASGLAQAEVASV